MRENQSLIFEVIVCYGLLADLEQGSHMKELFTYCVLLFYSFYLFRCEFCSVRHWKNITLILVFCGGIPSWYYKDGLLSSSVVHLQCASLDGEHYTQVCSISGV